MDRRFFMCSKTPLSMFTKFFRSPSVLKIKNVIRILYSIVPQWFFVCFEVPSELKYLSLVDTKRRVFKI